MTQNYLSFYSKSPSSYRSTNRPLTAISFMQNTDIRNSNHSAILKIKRKNSPKIKTIQYIKPDETDEQENQSTLLKLFDAKCLDSKITYSSEKALIFLNRFASANKRKLKLNGMDLGYNTMKILCSLLKSSDYYHIDLEKNKLGDASILELANLLSHNHTIVYLNLGSNGIKEVGSQHLFESLQYNSSLTHLELGSKNGYNKNAIKSGTKALCQSLKRNNTLIYLGLAYTQIGLLTLTNLYQGLKVNTSLLDLNLSSNELGESSMDFIIKILRYHDLHTLNLSHNQFGNDATKELFSFFNAYNRNLKLRHLIYNDNNINHKTGYYIFQALRSNISIQRLYLNQNNFASEINSLTYCLQQNSILEVLSFESCGSNGSFAKCISSGLAKNKGLKTLIFNNNKLGNDGGKILFKFLDANQHLNRLEVKRCELGDEAITSFAQYFKKNRSVQSIILSDNYINDEGGRKILDSIEHNTIIKEIALDSNLLGFRIYGYINSKLKVNKENNLNDKFPMKRDQLRVLENKVREEQLSLGIDQSSLVDKKSVLQQQVRELEQRLREKTEEYCNENKLRQRQLRVLEKQVRNACKMTANNKETQAIIEEIAEVRQKILTEKEAVVELERRCLGMVKKPSSAVVKKMSKRVGKGKPFAV